MVVPATPVYADETPALSCFAVPVEMARQQVVEVALNGQQYTSTGARIGFVPVVKSVTPPNGPTTGGTEVIVTVHGLRADSQQDVICQFGDTRVPAEDVEYTVTTDWVIAWNEALWRMNYTRTDIWVGSVMCVTPPSTVPHVPVTVSADGGAHFSAQADGVLFYHYFLGVRELCLASHHTISPAPV
jgi:hypothetical protein